MPLPTIPPLPSQGATSWYDYISALDAAVRAAAAAADLAGYAPLTAPALTGNASLNGSPVATTQDLDTKIAAAQGKIPAITTKTASFTFALGDEGDLLLYTLNTAGTATVPTNATVAFAVGTVLDVAITGTGALTLTPASGVTLQSPGNALRLTTQSARASLTKTATDTWLVSGLTVV